MNRALATVRSLSAALSVPRLLAALTLAVALLAIPAFLAEEASAFRTRASATKACDFLGGDLQEVPTDTQLKNGSIMIGGMGFSCDVPWGFGVAAFNCWPAPGTFDGMLICDY